MISFLKDKDFTLFTVPGVIIIGIITLLFSVALHRSSYFIVTSMVIKAGKIGLYYGGLGRPRDND